MWFLAKFSGSEELGIGFYDQEPKNVLFTAHSILYSAYFAHLLGPDGV